MVTDNKENNKNNTSSTIIQQDDGSYVFNDKNEFTFLKGGRLPELRLVYETYGRLNAKRDNAILVHHALSTGSHLCASSNNPSPGWWEAMVGPGKVVDTNKFYVICINNLGSCFGSSGPTSLNPATHRPYGKAFPALTIDDMVIAQHKLLQHLAIERLYAVIGNSMGGLLSLAWAIYFPASVARLLLISSSYKTYPINAVKHAIGREIVSLDTTPDQKQGLKIARKLAHLDYRSADELSVRFNTSKVLTDYLNYNAQKFIDYFDANAYIYLTQAMDWFDASRINPGRVQPNEGVDSVSNANPFKRITAKTLVVSVSTDTLFEPCQQQALAECLQEAGVVTRFVQHHSDRGHDAFYNDVTIGSHVQQWLAD